MHNCQWLDDCEKAFNQLKGEEKVIPHDRLLPTIAGDRQVNESDESVVDRQSIADTDSELSYDVRLTLGK